MTPKKYPQNLHTPQKLFFLNPPPPKKKKKKNSEIQNFEPKRQPEPRFVWKYQSNPPPPTPFIKYKCSLYFRSTYTWLNLIYYHDYSIRKQWCSSVITVYGRTPFLLRSYTNFLNITLKSKVSKVAKIRNRYNQVPHLTQDTNGKVTNSQKTPQTRAKSKSDLKKQKDNKLKSISYKVIQKTL